MVEMARLARHLASLSALEVKHRVIYMRVAVHHNLEVGNYGFAQRTLEVRDATRSLPVALLVRSDGACKL